MHCRPSMNGWRYTFFGFGGRVANYWHYCCSSSCTLTNMEPEKQADPPPYPAEQYPVGQYPPAQPQPYPSQPYPPQQYPQYPSVPVGAQPPPAPSPYAPASGETAWMAECDMKPLLDLLIFLARTIQKSVGNTDCVTVTVRDAFKTCGDERTTRSGRIKN